ncbi:uncharacterized protein LOC141631036 [Silene latifolia]|uniref:uncharacterized protein LOC141631036 n=1 Tax=Silene latifolia TaxID=37657 RepID=UPI003D77DD87
MLSQTLVKGYNRANVSPRCMIKVDIRKAFDSLQWSFIAAMLPGLGIPQQFIDWVLGCIQTPCMEVLSRYLRILGDKPLVSYHPKCSRLKLNHLIFADDLMIFVRGDVPSVAAVKDTLGMFAELSGLHANIEKTNIYFGGVHPNVKEAILDDTRLFSRSSNLINSVIFSMETFWCSCNLLPHEVLHKINKLCKDFFWGIPFEGSRMVFKNWRDICLPWDAGGFNIKDLSTWNDALQCDGFICWLILVEGSWASRHKAYILQRSTVWTIQTHDSFSSSLKGILTVRDRSVALTSDLMLLLY